MKLFELSLLLRFFGSTDCSIIILCISIKGGLRSSEDKNRKNQVMGESAEGGYWERKIDLEGIWGVKYKPRAMETPRNT